MKLKTKIWIAVGVIAALLIAQMWWRPSESRLQDGDIVFRGTNPALLGLTLSPWTHCGVLHKENGQWMVYEAIGTQHKKISLKKWRRHEAPYIFRVMRPKKALTDAQKSKIINRVSNLAGRKYDHCYSWTDQDQYCSELVWKGYKAAGIELSEPRKVDTFFVHKILPDAILEKIVKGCILKGNQPMVPPCDLVNSNKLKRVW